MSGRAIPSDCDTRKRRPPLREENLRHEIECDNRMWPKPMSQHLRLPLQYPPPNQPRRERGSC